MLECTLTCCMQCSVAGIEVDGIWIHTILDEFLRLCNSSTSDAVIQFGIWFITGLLHLPQSGSEWSDCGYKLFTCSAEWWCYQRAFEVIVAVEDLLSRVHQVVCIPDRMNFKDLCHLQGMLLADPGQL